MGKIKTWLDNGRAGALVQSAMPAVLTIILAIGTENFNICLSILAFVGVECAHLAMNLVDDYFDYKADMLTDRLNVVRKGFKAYTAKYPYLTDGSATLNDLRIVIAVFSAIALICGAVIFALRGWQVLLIAGITAFLGVFYSAPPFKLCYHGLGELVTGLIFGPLLMAGIYFSACGCVASEVWFLSVPVGLLVTNILFTHSYIDNVGDQESEKKTLASVLHSEKSRLAMSAILNFVPFSLVIIGVLLGKLHWAYLFTLIVLPRSLWLFDSLIKFSRNEEIPLDKPKRFLGNMGDWQKITEAGLGWYLIRWFTARNALSGFCLCTIIVRIILLFIL